MELDKTAFIQDWLLGQPISFLDKPPDIPERKDISSSTLQIEESGSISPRQPTYLGGDIKGAEAFPRVESLLGCKDVPISVLNIRTQLWKGIRSGSIPIGLKSSINRDHNILGFQDIADTDYDQVQDFSEHNEEGHLHLIYNEVKKIFINAQACKQSSASDNAWFADVFWPLLKLAIRLHGEDEVDIRTVQLQPIFKLPNTIAVEGKAHLLLTYSPHNPSIRKDSQIRRAQGYVWMNKPAISTFRVASPCGDQYDGQDEMSFLAAASIRQKLEIVNHAEPDCALDSFAEPCFHVVGHRHKVYYAYPITNEGEVKVLGPDDLEVLTISSLKGIFTLLRFYRNVISVGVYGSQVEEHGCRQPK